MDILKEIEADIGENPILLFMKGEKAMPMCGFSAQVVNLLNGYGVDYVTRNVLESDELRNGIKEFSDWPTIPQLYIRGEFVGGCDIVMQMHQSGQLEAKLSPVEK